MTKPAFTTLTRLDGTVFATGTPDISSRWGWIQEAVAREFELQADDVGCFEDDELNDFAAVDGKPVAQVHSGYLRNAAPVVRLLDAAE